MKSKTRIDCESAVEEFSKLIPQPTEILYVGTAGNPDGKFEQPHLFPNAKITTMDIDPKWKPDIVGDITNPLSHVWGQFDLVIMTQVIEHIPNFWDAPRGIALCLKMDGHAIIDCPPFNYPYHAEPPSFKDYWRISKDGMEYLMSKSIFLQTVKIIDTPNNVSVLAKMRDFNETPDPRI
jgi:hypothetical protein